MKKKKQRGRPRTAGPSRMMSWRAPDALMRRVEEWREQRSLAAGAEISKAAAMVALIERGLET